MATKARAMYMHTIDNQPAAFEDGMILFADVATWRGDRTRFNPRLVASLRQIRREQRQSRATRIAAGHSVSEFQYGYVRVEVPRG